MTDAVSDDLRAALPGYLARQRWYGGAGEPASVVVLQADHLAPRLQWVLVEADGAAYQLLLGSLQDAAPPEFLHGHDAAVVGVVDGALCYDGLLDAELALALLDKVSDGSEKAERVRPMGAEQSNTSLVYDERLVLKVFRRLYPGRNPDVQVTTALASVGFGHVADPVAVWREDDNDMDLAILQEFLAGASEGWALALTSLRDFYAAATADPAEGGGDFAAEAERLGRVTADMHLALAEAFGTFEPDVEGWATVMERQLERVAAGEPWAASAGRVLDRLRVQARDGAGRAVRTHGDYHLGQVLRTDGGWYVLDFEGEPARPLDERSIPTSPLKDVAGMLRSLHYASQVALRDRGEAERPGLEAKAEAWEHRNRQAFLSGYLGTRPIGELLPAGRDATLAALVAWELDKALYELQYERDYRPDWVDIPRGAIDRLLG